MEAPDKSIVLDRFRSSLRNQLEATASMTALSRDEATSDQSKPENKYDTRALEASYLAAGQGVRLGALKQLVTWLEAVHCKPSTVIGLGTLLFTESSTGSARWFFLAPQGGEKVEIEGITVELLGLKSPLGRALLGLHLEDEVEVDAPSGRRTWSVEYLA